MGFLKLGILSSLLSDSLMSGFTTGSAFHVLTSQVPHLLGYRIPKITGLGRLVKVSRYFNIILSFLTTLPIPNFKFINAVHALGNYPICSKILQDAWYLLP